MSLHPHLMPVNRTRDNDGATNASGSALNLEPASAFAELGAYLAEPVACLLEQELIDPLPVAGQL